MKIAALGLMAVVWIAPFLALAQSEQGEAVRLDYAAHELCPPAAAFIAAVTARTGRARFAVDGEQLRLFTVRLEAIEGQTDGKLTIIDPGEPDAPSERGVRGRDCAVVVDALALVAALAIDPAARLTVPPPPPPKPPPAIKPPPPPEPRLPAPLPLPRPRKPAEVGDWRLTMGAHAVASSGLGKLSAVLPVFLDLALYEAGWLAPSFRLGVSWLPDRMVDNPAGSGDFYRVTGRVSGCPINGPLLSTLIVRPCIGMEAGVLHAERADLSGTNDSDNGWLSFNLETRLQWFAADWLLLEVAAEGGVPLLRPRFHLEPDLTLLMPDPVYAAFGGGVGVRFP